MEKEAFIYSLQTKLKTLDELLDEIDMHQSVGAEIMMLESEGITEDLPPD